MNTVIICSIIALILTYLESRGQMKNGMKFGFMLVTILGAIHYNYGNDYLNYLSIYNEVTDYSFDLSGILAGDYFHDPGWVLLCWLFKPIGGFFMMVAVLNIIQNIIVYKFIKENVALTWWPFAVFVYLFSTNIYLLSFSMMRQMFVMMIFLGMWKFIIQREWWIPLIVLYLCSFIHSSAVILLPFAFWGFLPMRNARYVGVSYVILLVLLWFFKNTLNDIFQFTMSLNDVFSEYADTYENYDVGIKLGFGFIINMIPFALSIVFLTSDKNDHSPQTKSLVAIGAIAFFIAPFGQIIRLISRIGMYFSTFSIVTLPYIYGNIKNKTYRLALLSLYTMITLYDYYLFFTDSVFSEHYSTFHTIFSQI